MSQDTDAKNLPSGEKIVDMTSLLWSSIVLINSKFETEIEYKLTDSSSETEAKKLPSGEKLTDLT